MHSLSLCSVFMFKKMSKVGARARMYRSFQQCAKQLTTIFFSFCSPSISMVCVRSLLFGVFAFFFRFFCAVLFEVSENEHEHCFFFIKIHILRTVCQARLNVSMSQWLLAILNKKQNEHKNKNKQKKNRQNYGKTCAHCESIQKEYIRTNVHSLICTFGFNMCTIQIKVQDWRLFCRTGIYNNLCWCRLVCCLFLSCISWCLRSS